MSRLRKDSGRSAGIFTIISAIIKKTHKYNTRWTLENIYLSSTQSKPWPNSRRQSGTWHEVSLEPQRSSITGYHIWIGTTNIACKPILEIDVEKAEERIPRESQLLVVDDIVNLRSCCRESQFPFFVESNKAATKVIRTDLRTKHVAKYLIPCLNRIK